MEQTSLLKKGQKVQFMNSKSYGIGCRNNPIMEGSIGLVEMVCDGYFNMRFINGGCDSCTQYGGNTCSFRFEDVMISIYKEFNRNGANS